MFTVDPEKWVEVPEPVMRRWETWKREEIEFECSECGCDLGFVEGEYEGEYGLRLVQVWRDAWQHPDLPGVVVCEDCSMPEDEGEA